MLGELTRALWGEDAPASSVNVVQRHVGRLRRVLEPDLPVRASGCCATVVATGYRLRVDAESSDVPRFRRLVADARGADREAVRVYVDAIGLWSAPCAQRLRREPLGDQDFAALDRECLSAVAEAADAALRCGEVHDVLPLRRRVVPHDPLNEELHARLILVPAESGQQAEAESVYRAAGGRTGHRSRPAVEGRPPDGGRRGVGDARRGPSRAVAEGPADVQRPGRRTGRERASLRDRDYMGDVDWATR